MLFVAVFIVLVFFYSLISARLERTFLSGPLIFTLAGMLLFFANPIASYTEIKSETILFTGEITLVLVLFIDASSIQTEKLQRGLSLPGRLLLIGMPLTILFGSLVGWILLPNFRLVEAAILGTILAPTDAGLGKMVVSDKRIPEKIRRALNVESGLNDGLSVPFLMLFIGIAAAETAYYNQHWILFTLQQVGLGLLIGGVLGFLGGRMIRYAQDREWISETFIQISLLALALLCWGAADEFGGNGFIAAFTGGLLVRQGFFEARGHSLEFDETWGDLLNLLVFMVFGVLAAEHLKFINPMILIYALLSLTLVRMVPVWISLVGTGLGAFTKVFLGWFGPRGLASIVLGLIFLEQEINLPNQSLIQTAIITTVLFSVIAHGVSTNPGIEWFTKRAERLPQEAPEFAES